MAQYEKREILLRIMAEEGFKTKAAFAERLGVSPAVVSNWIARDSFPVFKVISAFPHINPEFTRFGNEPYLKDASKPNRSARSSKSIPEKPAEENFDRLIAVIEKQQSQIDRLISIIESRCGIK